MFIKQLILTNWCRYAGTHSLALEPKVYAITAQHEFNRERSNWLGKSTLIESIPFALFGTHRFNRDDDWISRGCNNGSVTVQLSNGAIITRSRDKVTKLGLILGREQLTGDLAQVRINQMIGLSQSDFYATCFFEQRQIAKFVLAEPSERMSMVKGWLQLEKLDCAVDIAKEKLQSYTVSMNLNSGSLRTIDMMIQEQFQILHSNGINESIDESNLDKLEPIFENMRTEIARLEGVVTRGEIVKEKIITYNNHLSRANALTDIVAKGQSVAASIAANGQSLVSINEQINNTQTRINALLGEMSIVRKKREYHENIISQGFDGMCPVINDVCPSSEHVSKCNERNRQIFDEQVSVLNTLSEDYKKSVQNIESLKQRASMVESWERQRIELRNLYTQAVESTEWLKCNNQPEHVDSDSLNQLKIIENQLVKLTNAHQQILTLISKREAFKQQYDNNFQMVEIYSMIIQCLGTSGAQRIAAEQSLSEIQDNANALLTGIGINLHTNISWYKEGLKLSNNCELCGHPFGTTQKVKKCTKCGHDRAKAKQYKLTLELSDRSGAAEDLAGAAYQLAASAWLRVARGTAWGTAILDEPFGQLDTSNKKVFSRHLDQMLKSKYGFEQAFIVAHDRHIMASYPGQIEIVANMRSNKVNVK